MHHGTHRSHIGASVALIGSSVACARLVAMLQISYISTYVHIYATAAAVATAAVVGKQGYNLVQKTFDPAGLYKLAGSKIF